MTWHDYASEVLRIYFWADTRDELLWRVNTDASHSWPIVFMAACSDTFGWAISEAEDIQSSDLDLLNATYEDLRALDEEGFLSTLYAARKRERRPFPLWMHRNTLPGSELRRLFEALPDKGAT